MGNHDKGASNYKRTYSYIKDYQNDGAVNGIDNHLFDEVYEGPLFISEKIMLSHEPYDLPFAANIHGHDHAGKMYHGHNVNLASNVCGFTPVSLAELIKGGLISKVPTIHRICIDKANKNPIHKKENK